MGLLDLPTLKDFVPWLDHSIPSDKRDFERPREGFYSSTTPTDLHSVDEIDLDKFIPTSESPSERVKREEEEAEKEKATVEQPKKEAPQDQDKLITAFQSFFSKSHPVIGKLYSGPKDGKMNPQLKAAARSAEAKIGSVVGSSVSGMILSGEKFSTSPGDVSTAVALIAKHEGKTSSYLSRDERISAFSSFMIK